MAKSTPTTIAQAAKCVSKVRQGKACSVAELRASLLLIDDGLKTARSTIRMLKERVSFLTGFLNRG